MFWALWSFKIESSTQDISLQRKGGRIYDSALHTVRIIYQNRKKNFFFNFPLIEMLSSLHNPPTTYISSGRGMGTEKRIANFSFCLSRPPQGATVA